jgi:hypothetical protein
MTEFWVGDHADIVKIKGRGPSEYYYRRVTDDKWELFANKAQGGPYWFYIQPGPSLYMEHRAHQCRINGYIAMHLTDEELFEIQMVQLTI